MAKLITPVPYEPLRTNRWLLSVAKIPEYLFSDLNIQTTMDQKNVAYTKLTFSILNIINYVVSPQEVIYEKRIRLKFLDPTGVVVNGYDLDVEFEMMTLDCIYSDDSLLKHKFSFWVRHMTPFFENVINFAESENSGEINSNVDK